MGVVHVHVVIPLNCDETEIRVRAVQLGKRPELAVVNRFAIRRYNEQRRTLNAFHDVRVLSDGKELAIRYPEPHVIGQHVFLATGPQVPSQKHHTRLAVQQLAGQRAVHPMLDTVKRLVRMIVFQRATLARQNSVLELQQRVQRPPCFRHDLLRVRLYRTGGVQQHELLDVFRVHGGEQLGHLSTHAVAHANERGPPHVVDYTLHRQRVILHRPPYAIRSTRRQAVVRPVQAQVQSVTVVQQRDQAVKRRTVVLKPVEAQYASAAITFPTAVPEFCCVYVTYYNI